VYLVFIPKVLKSDGKKTEFVESENTQPLYNLDKGNEINEMMYKVYFSLRAWQVFYFSCENWKEFNHIILIKQKGKLV
jgi:hypothetical protein